MASGSGAAASAIHGCSRNAARFGKEPRRRSPRRPKSAAARRWRSSKKKSNSTAKPSRYAGCRSPDIDVDRDGLEIFCDSNLDDTIKEVDLCVDGDGTEIRDEVVGGNVVHCTAAMRDGKPRFVDGISVELNFATAPANLAQLAGHLV